MDLGCVECMYVFIHVLKSAGAWRSVVVKALRY